MTDEAVPTRRERAAPSPDRGGADLASLLNGLAAIHERLGQSILADHWRFEAEQAAS